MHKLIDLGAVSEETRGAVLSKEHDDEGAAKIDMGGVDYQSTNYQPLFTGVYTEDPN